MTRSQSVSVALGALGVVFIVVAALYALGVLQILTSSTSGPHYKHAVLFVVLAVASFVAANFARPKTA
ncbi:MAG: hypothetical protein E6I27_05335 [Chloroflexi bacterium]|nr:MAG: hypothetical protein E6I96_07340 [Chloroflexota bacterium]TMF38483.1 MAG: hypothetical protein E6I27_05335 [Chloroflexota bacterium]